MGARRLHVVHIQCLGILLLTGCAMPTIYESPAGNFEVSLPELGAGMRWQEALNENGGSVSFHSDFGQIKSIVYMKLPLTAPETLGDPGKRAAAIRGFLHDFAMPVLFEPVSPETKILFERLVGPPDDSEYLAVVEIPEGSTLMDMRTGKRLDSTRALLIFPDGGYMYMLTQSATRDEIKNPSQVAFEDFRAAIRFHGQD